MRIPAYVYLPWFAVALGGVIVGAPYDAGWRTWTWDGGACLPYRTALLALVMWGWCSRWMRDRVLERRDRRAADEPAPAVGSAR